MLLFTGNGEHSPSLPLAVFLFRADAYLQFPGRPQRRSHNLLRNDVTAIFEIESTKIEISLRGRRMKLRSFLNLLSLIK
jgi:hypothetical protein